MNLRLDYIVIRSLNNSRWSAQLQGKSACIRLPIVFHCAIYADHAIRCPRMSLLVSFSDPYANVVCLECLDPVSSIENERYRAYFRYYWSFHFCSLTWLFGMSLGHMCGASCIMAFKSEHRHGRWVMASLISEVAVAKDYTLNTPRTS